MRIELLYNAPPGFGLEPAAGAIVSVLTELGFTVKETDLRAESLWRGGNPSGALNALINDMRGSDGAVFLSAAPLPCLPAPLAAFLECAALPEHAGALNGKNCLLIMASENGGERSALDSLSRALQALGAFDCARAGLQRADVDALGEGGGRREDLERLVEDFYRAIRQNRRFFAPLDYPRAMPGGIAVSPMPQNAVSGADGKEKQKLSINELAKKLNFDELDENQAGDINEISDYFSKLISEHRPADSASEPVFVKTLTRGETEPLENHASCKQLTKNLAGRFQPQLSDSLNAIIQLQISGDETFSACLAIQNNVCAYSDGAPLSPDITIIADASVWRDVCGGKYTAQKAFMIGRLKVRGNFVLLTKFDHLFHLGK